MMPRRGTRSKAATRSGEFLSPLVRETVRIVGMKGDKPPRCIMQLIQADGLQGCLRADPIMQGVVFRSWLGSVGCAGTQPAWAQEGGQAKKQRLPRNSWGRVNEGSDWKPHFV